MSAYSKTITALVTGVLGWAGVVITSADAAISAAEWLGLAVVVATALGVYAVPNTGQPRDARGRFTERGAAGSFWELLGVAFAAAVLVFILLSVID